MPKRTAVFFSGECPFPHFRWDTASEFPNLRFCDFSWSPQPYWVRWLSHRPHLDYKGDNFTPLFLIQTNQSIMFVALFELVLTNTFWRDGRRALSACWWWWYNGNKAEGVPTPHVPRYIQPQFTQEKKWVRFGTLHFMWIDWFTIL